MRTRWRMEFLVLTGLSSLAPLTLHGYVGTYSRYIADDSCSARLARRRRRGHHFLP
jgi:hypothetical protein